MPHDTIIELFVHVDSIGAEGARYLPNRTVTLTAAAIDSAGRGIDGIYGHFHPGLGGVSKPVGGFLPGNTRQKVVNTGDSIVTVRFRTGPVSGPVILRAESEGAKPAVDTVPVGVFRLVPLVERTSDTLIGQLDEHPENHYVLPWVAELLDALADSAHAQFARRLYYNDCSLAFGGLFDLSQRWQPEHYEHRAGRDCDLRTNGSGGLSEPERRYVQRVWEVLGGTVHDETRTAKPHYHLRYRR